MRPLVFGALRTGLALALVTSLAACGLIHTKTPFAHSVGDAAATLAAAQATLEAAHAGKLSREYANATFVNYREALDGVAEELPTLRGAPDEAVDLAASLAQAVRIVNQPCLGDDCDFAEQTDTLETIANALREASGP